MISNKRALIALALTVAFSSAALAQVPVWKFDPADRAIGDGGPAPKRDFTGSWAGPRSGAGVPDPERGDAPVLTPMGKKLFEQAHTTEVGKARADTAADEPPRHGAKALAIEIAQVDDVDGHGKTVA